jgi:predicted TIM-barrel fold metal-dependent hydrolase
MMAHGSFKVVDSDMHVIEPPDLWQRYIDPAFREKSPYGTNAAPRDISCYIGNRSAYRTDAIRTWVGPIVSHTAPLEKDYEFAAQRGFDAVSQLEAMDREGIDVAVLYPSRGLFVLGFDSAETAGPDEGLEPAFVAAIARAYNDWLYEFCAQDRRRLLAAAMIAPHDLDQAVIEARRSVEKLGFRSIFLLPGLVNRRPWHDRHYDPLWAECERLDIPVVFHGGGPDRLGDYGLGLHDSMMLWHTFSHSLGPMAACASFTAGGVLARFPKLRAGFLEANCSWAPWLLARLDDHYEDYIGRFEFELPLLPSEYFRRNCYVSVEADEKPARLFVDWFGDDNVVFSTDYPHPDSKFPHGVDKFLSLSLSDDTKRKFLWDNCARFYKIDS